MPRLDVEKNHKSIRSTLSNPKVVDQTTSVEVASKYSQKTGRTRIPPGLSGTSPLATGKKPPKDVTNSTSPYERNMTAYGPSSPGGALIPAKRGKV